VTVYRVHKVKRDNKQDATNSVISFNIILPAVLYGCRTWSLTLREKQRLRVFENWTLGKLSGPKREELTWDVIRLHT